MGRVTRTQLAADDILDIWDHIAKESVSAADRWVDKLDEQFNLIATQPLMGRARQELADSVRSFPFGRYVIFYVPLEDGIDGTWPSPQGWAFVFVAQECPPAHITGAESRRDP